MSNHNKPEQSNPLMKHHSFPMDVKRDEAWLRKKKKRRSCSHHRSKSIITNDDIEELKGCFELGFKLEPDSPDFNPRLTKTIPALDLYCAVNRQYNNHLSRSPSLEPESDVSNSNTNTTMMIIDKGDDTKEMKYKLKQWAKVVACSVKHSSDKPN